MNPIKTGSDCLHEDKAAAHKNKKATRTKQDFTTFTRKSKKTPNKLLSGKLPQNQPICNFLHIEFSLHGNSGMPAIFIQKDSPESMVSGIASRNFVSKQETLKNWINNTYTRVFV